MDRSVREATDGCNDDRFFTRWMFVELAITAALGIVVVAGRFLLH
jgi:hypothetical protein